jgi:transcriptional regulator with XRE-family HTH domain
VAAKRIRLARVRRAAGFTQEQLAEALGVDVSTLRRWEAGDTEPLPYKRQKLARLLDISRARLDGLLSETPVGAAGAVQSVGESLDGDDTTVEALRSKLEHIQRDYDVVPSTSLLATASQTHGRIGALRNRASSKRHRREVVALEAESATFMGQLVWDASQRRDHQSPRRYFDQAIQAAQLSGDKVTEAYAKLRTSYLSLYGDKAASTGLRDAQLAADTAQGTSPALTGLALLHVAEANAMLGQRTECDQALDDARGQLALIHDVDIAGDYLTSAEINRMAGSCYLFLGLSGHAEAALRPAATALEGRKKSQSIVLGNLSLAYIQQGELDGAAEMLHQTIDAVEASRGGGGLALAFEAGQKLAPWRREPVVQELHDRLFTLMTPH